MTVQSGYELAPGARLRASLVVVGAGPAGIVCAVEAARRGVDVLLIESGGREPDPHRQRLSTATVRHPNLHAPVELTVSRQIGGTSAIWGGRCVPYDEVDFLDRPITAPSRWPLSYPDVQPYFDAACDWFKCGRSAFDVKDLPHLPAHMVPGLPDGDVLASTLERWSLPTHFGREYGDVLTGSTRLRVLTDSTCVRVDIDEDLSRATGVTCKTLAGGTFSVEADRVIVAAGGLESTRLLMCSPAAGGRSAGDHSGHLGHWYMAHLEGVIADLVLCTPAAETVHGYERDVDGTYVRRRLTFAPGYQLEHGLPNIAGWIANPELPDASHRNVQLSLTYLALVSPLGSRLAPPAQRLSLTGTKIPGTPYGTAARSPMRAHLRNVLSDPAGAARFAVDFGAKRVFSRGRKPPGFFVWSADNRYPLQYHGEHLPHYESCVRLAAATDELGMPRLDIDIKFTDDDIQGVLAAHRHWDRYLRTAGVGRLEYVVDDPAAAVLARAGGGFHQIGTTRMAASPADGVVDTDLAVHGIPNLHVVSSSVFVTSGQANSTFLIVVLALRLIGALYDKADSAIGGIEHA
ncbi:GMC family oxidoreductase [Mycolicibacterium cosmeticum]|uniref:Glucose-methanol-choline oxidoreductase n=1 Tax=Mycolicibacterium cosmeticum TaxID=258533 RepID=W9APM7_MYCCO|nr:GMC oxidoreductase [Mycolicibacterium cosmeticum]TLH80264.1 GMC family oxidoreductase [Mycolicibacterium cosmeticum]CDO07443.1 glucose-methanol-choline oxidoreductase [Mycolicibacterium cosmeticum]